MGGRKEKSGRLFCQTPPELAPQNYATKIFETKQIDIEKSKYRRTGTGQGCAETSNSGVIQKPDNPFKGIKNPIPRNLDNYRKVIRKLVPNRIWSQRPIGLTVTS